MTVLLGFQGPSGTTAGSVVSQHAAYRRFTAGASGQLSRITVNLKVANPTLTGFHVGLYSDSAGAPGSRLAIGVATDQTAYRGSAEFSVGLNKPYTITSGTAYWLAFWGNGETVDFQGDSSAGAYREDANANSTGLPGSPSTSATSNVAFIIYGDDALLLPTQRGSAGAAVWSADPVVTPTNLTPALPSGYAVGDLLLCATACRSATPTVATPAGWTQLLNTTGTNGRLALFGKIATSTSETAPTVAWSSLTTGTSGTPCGAQCTAFYNMLNTTTGMVDVTGTVENGSASTSAAASGTGITTTKDRALIVSVSTRLDDAGTWTTPYGFSTIGSGGTTSGLDFALAWSFADQSPPSNAGVSAPADYSLSGASSFASSGVLVALRPVVAPRLLSLADSVTATPTVKRASVTKRLSVTVSSVDTLRKLVDKKPFLVTVTTTPTLTKLKRLKCVLNATTTATVSLWRQTTKTLTDTSTATSTVRRRPTKALTRTVALTPTIARARRLARVLTAISSLTAARTTAVFKRPSATVTVSPAVSRKPLKRLSVALSAAPSIRRRPVKRLSAVSTLTATTWKRAGRKLTATVTGIATAVTQKIGNVAAPIGVTLSATVTAVATVRRSTVKRLSAVIVTAPTVRRATVKRLSATSTVSATVRKLVGKRLAATPTVVGSLVTRLPAAILASVVAGVRRAVLTRIGVSRALLAESGTVSLRVEHGHTYSPVSAGDSPAVRIEHGTHHVPTR